MKLLIKVLLSIIFIPLFVITVFLVSAKYQMLSINFWKESLIKGNVYSTLSKEIKNFTETKTLNGGGKVGDVKILTDMATPLNVQDFVEKNISNILAFTTNKKNELIIYVPFSKLPSGLKPQSEALSSDYLPYTALAQKFNIDREVLSIGQLAYLGRTIDYAFVISVSVLILISILLVLIDKNSKQYQALGINLLISGPILILCSKIFSFMETSFIRDSQNLKEPGFVLFSIIAPPILSEIFRVWIIVGTITFAVGIVLIFLGRNKNIK